MLTLKQIREKYDSVPQNLMLEAKKDDNESDKKPRSIIPPKRELKSNKNLIPSNAEMPPILMFRRITYKVYPNKQVIALYYARSIDKYLSVPFGPGGNVNLGEARIVDITEEDNEFKFSNPENLSCRDTLRMKVNEMRQERINEVGPLALAWGAAKGLVTGAIKGISSNVLGGGSSNNDPKRIQPKQANVKVKTKTSKDLAKNASDAVFKSKMKTYELGLAKQPPQPIKENKMSDLRKMINEGTETKDFVINGRPITINTTMAKRILEVYDSVNTKNKKIVESMLNTDLESFKKLLKFSIKAQ